MQNTNILGAGMAGLLAANMMRRRCPTVFEAKNELPDLHKAVLRFRNQSVSEATGIPFQKIKVNKSLYTHNGYKDKPSVQDANNYSLKATGAIEDRSIWNLDRCVRYLAPNDFVQQMANSIEVEYGVTIGKANIEGCKESGDLTISTLPMPVMMRIVDWKTDIKFMECAKPIYVIRCKLKKPMSRVHQTIYNSSLFTHWYRGSIHGDDLIIECDVDVSERSRQVVYNFLSTLCSLNSTDIEIEEETVHTQPFGKILSIDEHERQEFIYFLTKEYNVYSLGRFATWRPLLMDAIVDDVRKIEKLSGTSHYNHNHKTKIK